MKHLLELCRPVQPGVLALAACLSLGLASPLQAGEIVFDNTQKDFNNMFYPSMFEYGDQITLGGSARTLTEFQFEYVGDFSQEREATVIVRIYANDAFNPYPTGDFSPPGTLLHESGPRRIFPDYNVLAFKNLSIPVSNYKSITWTVQFGGLSGTNNDRAGLTYYDAPTVGSSYDDFWVKLPDGWTLFSTEGNPPSNFAARVFATPETPIQVIASTANADGSHAVQLQGPPYRGAVLEVATGPTNWQTVSQFLFPGHSLTVQDKVPRGETPVYRVRESSTPVLQLSAGRPDFAGRMALRASGAPSRGFVLEAAWDMAGWFPILTNDFVSMDLDFKDAMAFNFGRRFYRASYTGDLAAAMGNISFTVNNETLLKASGPPGRDCVVEYSKNLSTWLPLATNVFGFTTKTVVFVDPATTNLTRRFYRIRVGP